METNAIIEPKLLVDDYNSYSSIIKRIINNSYYLIDERIPIARFRGTIIKRLPNENLQIIGWQRNILKMRKETASLPTIITLLINNSGEIEEIQLDNSFKGSKGLLCSYNYLKNNVKKLISIKLNKKILSHIKLDDMQCYHLTEVLRGIYSFYNFLERNNQKEILKRVIYEYEEEVINSYLDGDTLFMTGLQQYKNNQIIRYAFKFEDIFKKINYDNNINLYVLQGVKADFFINNKLYLTKKVNINDESNSYPNIVRFLTESVQLLKDYMLFPDNIKLFNTNIYPIALVGLLTQSIGIRLFRNNYNYMLKVFDSIQRINGRPGCVGALTDQDEADKYFSGYLFSEIFN